MNVDDALRKAFEDEAADVEAIGPSPGHVERALAMIQVVRGAAAGGEARQRIPLAARVLPAAMAAGWLAVAGVAVFTTPGRIAASATLAAGIELGLPDDPAGALGEFLFSLR